MPGRVGSHRVCRYRYVKIDTTQELNKNNLIMNLITIVMDKKNYRCMAQLSHIEAQLYLCGRVGP